MSKHLKRLAMPRVWTIPKKTHVWSVRPSPGPHPKEQSVPLLYVLRDLLKVCDTGSEARRIIGAREILVDGKIVKDYKRPVGFMDVIAIPKINGYYRTLLDSKGKIRLVRITREEASWKLVRIENKTTTPKGKIQLNLHDGRNVLVQEDVYRTGDVLKLEVPSQAILTRYQMTDGNVAMIIGGKHAGRIAPISSYIVTRNPKPNIVEFKEGFSTVKDYVFVVGTRTPEITVPEVSAL